MTLKKILAASIATSVISIGGITEIETNASSASQIRASVIAPQQQTQQQTQTIGINSNSVETLGSFYLNGNRTLEVTISSLQHITVPVNVTLEKRESNSWVEVQNYLRNVNDITTEVPSVYEENLAPGTYRLKVTNNGNAGFDFTIKTEVYGNAVG